MPNSNSPTPLDSDIALWAEQLDDDSREYFEERAAVFQYEAGMTRLQAETKAKTATENYLTRKTGGNIDRA